jgi:hypothetical protein
MAADRASVIVERLLQTRGVLLDGRWRAAVVDVVPDALPASPLWFLFPDIPSVEPAAARLLEEARAEVSAHGGQVWAAEGQPDDDSGTLTGIAVAGLSHEDVAALAARLGATFVVQVDEDEVRVLDASGATVGCRPRDWAEPWESEELDEEELAELFTEAFEAGRNVVVVGTDRWVGRLELPGPRLVWTCGDDEIELDVDADQESIEEFGVEESQYPGGDSGYELVAVGSGSFLRYGIYSWSSGELDDLGDLPDEEAARQAFWEHLGYPDGEPERDDEDEEDDEDDDEDEEDDEDPDDDAAADDDDD